MDSDGLTANGKPRLANSGGTNPPLADNSQQDRRSKQDDEAEGSRPRAAELRGAANQMRQSDNTNRRGVKGAPSGPALGNTSLDTISLSNTSLSTASLSAAGHSCAWAFSSLRTFPNRRQDYYPSSRGTLLANIQTLDDVQIALRRDPLEVIQQTTTPADHRQ